MAERPHEVLDTDTVSSAQPVKFTLVLLRTDPEQHPLADVCNRCGAMVGDIKTHRAWHGQEVTR